MENKSQTIIRTIFGIFMIIVYIGMGILFMTGFFGTMQGFEWFKYVCGILLILYGIWRGYRQFKGIDSNINE